MDRLRLVEISLPPGQSSFVPQEAVDFFDAARKEYDLGNYRECIEKSRYVRDALNRILKTTSSVRLGDVLVNQRGIPLEPTVRDFWDGVWQSWWNITNEGHHNPSPQPFTAQDARACLMTGAVILEFLGQLR
jgi:hypothetical protein